MVKKNGRLLAIVLSAAMAMCSATTDSMTAYAEGLSADEGTSVAAEETTTTDGIGEGSDEGSEVKSEVAEGAVQEDAAETEGESDKDESDPALEEDSSDADQTTNSDGNEADKEDTTADPAKETSSDDGETADDTEAADNGESAELGEPLMEEAESDDEEEKAVLNEDGDENGEDDVIAYFSFNDKESGLSGNGAVATPKRNATFIEESPLGDGAIHLERGDWFDVKDENGKNILSGLSEITINYFSKTLDSDTSWTFFAAPDTSGQVYRNEKYLGIGDMIKGSVNVERYYSTNLDRPASVYAPASYEWKMVTFTADADGMTLYIDGEKKSTQASTAALENIFGDDNGILQIGKANWGSGEYANVYLDDMTIYNKALTGEEVSALYDEKSPEIVEEDVIEKDLGIRVTDVDTNYESDLEVDIGQDYSLIENTGAKLSFNNGKTKEDAVIVWYDENGKRVLNTKELSAGTHNLTGKLSYFGSPVIDEKADPYVIYNSEDEYYYFTSSWPAYGSVNEGYNRIALRRSKTLAGLSEAEDVAIWTANSSGELSAHIWAPELHKIGDNWYIYFAGCGAGGIWDIRPYVLRCTDSSDLLNHNKWELMGRFVNKDGGYTGAFDAFSLDMTYFENGDKSYVIWAYKTDASVLKIAEVNKEEPWKLSSDPVTISKPDYYWEMNGNQKINEGPAVLKKDGKIYVAFSGSTTGPEYCMGILTADEDADLMNPSSWTKRKTAALSTEDLVGQYGPGHNSFTVDKDGNIIIVYHARDEECYNNECEWANCDPLYDPCRNANMAILRFDENNNPVFTSTEKVEMQDLRESDTTFSMTVKVGNVMDELNADADEVVIPNADDIRGNITLPDNGKNGSVITWKSSNPDVITDTDDGNFKKGVVTRGSADENVVLTATLELGGKKIEKSFDVTVKAKADDKEFTHYLFAYFTGEGTSNGEQIYFADSNDGLKWSALNKGNPVIESTLGEKGLRDPFIIRSPENDKFYLIATDLKINGNGDWGKAQRAGSKSIMVWESTDLVNWGEQRMVKVADEAAGCTWAPEAFYNDQTGEYIVFWASMINGVHKIWYATTRDFYSFSKPQIWISLKNINGDDISIIDTSVFAVNNADGTKTYYRFSKDEAGSNAQVAEGDPASGKFEILESATSLLGEWTRIPSSYLSSTTGVEGGTMFKFNGEDKYCLLLDSFGAGGYFPSVTTDVASGEFTKLEKGEYSFPSTMRHGTVIGITDEEYQALEDKWHIKMTLPEIEYDTTLPQAAIAHFTFDDEEKGFAGNGAVATPHNGYDFVDRDGGKAVSITAGSKQYFSIAKEDGSSILTGLDEMTINFFSNTNVAKVTQWLFYAAENENAPSYNNEKYLGIIDPLSNDTLFHVERYNNKGSRLPNNVVNVSELSNAWKMITVVLYKDKTAVYVNGELESVVESSVTLSDIFGENGIAQIGKANWGGGEYTTAKIDEFSIFDRAINDSEVMALYEGKVNFDEKPEVNPGGSEGEDPGNTGDNPGSGEGNDPGNTEGNNESGESQESGKADTVNVPDEKTPEAAGVQNQSQEAVKDEIPVVTGTLKKIKKGKNKGSYRIALENGGYAKGLVKFGGKTYYFNKNGIAKKGFKKVNGKKIYTNAKGKVATGFKFINGSMYHFDKDGVMTIGKIKVGKLVYKFGKNGKLKKISAAK
ncbi:MAG: hypothetical protein E7301_06880 [Butyrivibrio sp.]|nr:hypothetical protein [Butyrivibrio sp.]